MYDPLPDTFTNRHDESSPRPHEIDYMALDGTPNGLRSGRANSFGGGFPKPAWEHLGKTLAVVSTFLFTLTLLGIKKLGKNGMPVFQVLLYQLSVEAVVCSLILLCKRMNPFGSKARRKQLALRSFASVFSIACLCFGIVHISFLEAVAIFATTPIWTGLAIRIYLRQRLQYLSFFLPLCALGAFLAISRPFTHGISQHCDEDKVCRMFVSLIVLFAALANSVTSIWTRKIGCSEDTFVTIFWTCFIGLPLFVLIAFLYHENVATDRASLGSLAILLDSKNFGFETVGTTNILIIVGIGISGLLEKVCYIMALQLERLYFASALRVMIIVWAYPLQFGIFHSESINYEVFIGNAVTIAATIFIAYVNAKIPPLDTVGSSKMNHDPVRLNTLNSEFRSWSTSTETWLPDYENPDDDIVEVNPKTRDRR